MVAVVVLALLVGVLAAAETSLTASSRIKLHHLHQKGDKRAGLVLELQGQMGQVISTILLANTWALTSMTALVTGTLTLWFGAMGTVYAAGFLSIFITIYLEVVPKMLAFQNPEKIAIFLVSALNTLRWALSPVTAVVDYVARVSMSLFGIKRPTHTVAATLEELHGAIDLHVGEGSVAHERMMLKNILDLTQVTVARVMVHRNKIFSLDIQEAIEKNLERMLRAPYTRIPLWQGNPDNVVGLLHTKALFRGLKRCQDPSELDLWKLMSVPWFIPETTSLLMQLQSFREKKAHLAFVVDEYGSLQGMVTLEDILEEIVGDIVDEHDSELPGVRPMAGYYIIQGTVTLRDLNRQYNWRLPEEKATTLAGLILEESGHIPDEGLLFSFYGLEIKVLQRHRNQITLLRVQEKKGLNGKGTPAAVSRPV
jgi:Mg2+/Co2+ transporter CorB